MITRRLLVLAVSLCALRADAQNGRPSPASTASIATGRTHWLRYDTEARQVLPCEGLPPSIDSASIFKPDPSIPEVIRPTEVALKTLHNGIINCTLLASNAGDGNYAQAEAAFRQAFSATPADPRAFRQLAMVLAEKGRWRELEIITREQITRDRSDVWAWLTLGLVMHRSGASARATAVFDSALALSTPQERARLFAFQRLLGPRDASAYEKSNAANRARAEESFWRMADPLWSREGGEPRTEFLSRVTFAELRWTVEEHDVLGADSDRGEAYIRFGPPDRIIAMRGSNFHGSQTERAGAPRSTSGTMLPQRSDVVTFWDYDNGLSLVFWGAPTYGTARFPNSDGAHIARAIEIRSAAFDNMSRERVLDIATRHARFRATPDSVDLLVLARAPMALILSDVAGNTPVHAHFWLLSRDGPVQAHDSTVLRASGIGQQMFRVGPASYQYRVEATATGSLVAARSLASLTVGPDTTGFALRGFGISDLLLASVARPREPRVRWSDFDVAPVLDVLPRRGNLEIIWETYELGARTGQSQYNVAVTLRRQRSASGRIAAAIVGFAANAVGIDRSDDRVTFRFDRTVSPGPVTVDHVSVAMGDTPAGDYTLTLEVTDKVSGRKSARTTTVSIRD